MKAKFGRVVCVNLISAVLAGMLFACSAVAFSPSDDEKDRKERKNASPPPARTAPAQSQPAAVAPHRNAERAPQQPTRTAPPNNAPRNTPPVQNNTPPAQNNTPQGYNNPRVNRPQVNTPPQPRENQPNGNQPFGRRPQTNTPGQSSPTYAPSNPNRSPAVNVPNNPNQQRGYQRDGSTPATREPFRSNAGPRSYESPRGSKAEFRGGTVHTLTTNSGMRINHVGPTREVIVRRGDRVFVTNARGNGYVQRDVIVRNQRFVQRTYSYQGVRYAHVYRPYSYRGAVVNVYVPVRYYQPGFYEYAYSPWRAPVYYRWGWASDPWYGGYGAAYFSPYPFYPRPSWWLTDYLIAMSFREAYQANLDAGVANATAQNNFAAGAPMGDDIKQLVSEEVQRQLAWERSQAQQQQLSQNDPPPSADPPVLADRASHTLLAYTSLNADAGGQECAITEGDVLRFDASQPLSGTAGSVQVLWSKPEDCRSGSVITLPIDQLQEMQNHMAENLNQGLQEMQRQQGQNGMPALAPNLVGSSQAPFAAELPPPEANVADELKRQAQEADSAVNQVTEEANRAWAPPVAQPQPQQPQQIVQRPATRQTITIVKNMPMQDVINLLGNPGNSFDMGKQKIFIYTNPNMKITFKNGKVDKVE
jgi:hypothetical protein